MRFEIPLALLSLVLLPALAVGYILARRRGPRYAVHFTNLEVLGGVALRLSARREHAIASLGFAALALLCVAVARPQITRVVPVENATVLLVVDTSRSMLSSDIAPTRLGAAKQAAHTFLDRVPDRLRIGLVTFAGDVTVAAFPTHDREQLHASVAGISRWSAGGGTAIGDALVRAVELAGDAVGERGLSTRSDGKDGKESPVTILFLSDGRQNRGLIPPKQGAAAAKGAGIPVFTVALGTDRPDRGGFGFGGWLQPHSRQGDAQCDRAHDRRRVLRSAFGRGAVRRLSRPRLASGRAERETEVTFLFVAAAGIALAAAAGLSRIWAPGLP